MRIDIITVLPELLESPLGHSIIKRACNKGLAEINIINLRDFTTDKRRTVDDYQYGGDAGMVMMIEPIDKAISYLKSQRDYDEIIYTSPDGEILNKKPLTHCLQRRTSSFSADITRVSTTVCANTFLLRKFLSAIMCLQAANLLLL